MSLSKASEKEEDRGGAPKGIPLVPLTFSDKSAASVETKATRSSIAAEEKDDSEEDGEEEPEGSFLRDRWGTNGKWKEFQTTGKRQRFEVQKFDSAEEDKRSKLKPGVQHNNNTWEFVAGQGWRPAITEVEVETPAKKEIVEKESNKRTSPTKRSANTKKKNKHSSSAPKFLPLNQGDVIESEDLFSASVDDIECESCGKTDDDKHLLLCGNDDGDGCGKGYHTYCLSPALTRIPKGDWFCDACNNRCEVCLKTDNAEGMLLCGTDEGDGCGKGHHLACFSPPMSEIPKGDWYCSRCEPIFKVKGSKKNGEGSSSGSNRNSKAKSLKSGKHNSSNISSSKGSVSRGGAQPHQLLSLNSRQYHIHFASEKIPSLKDYNFINRSIGRLQQTLHMKSTLLHNFLLPEDASARVADKKRVSDQRIEELQSDEYFLTRYLDQHPLFDKINKPLLVQEYQRWVHMRVVFRDFTDTHIDIVCPELISNAWAMHMGYSEAYALYCTEICGHYIHRLRQNFPPQCSTETADAYRCIYGDLPPKEIWGEYIDPETVPIDLGESS